MENLNKLCLGTWSLSGKFNYHDKILGRGSIDRKTVENTLSTAVESGITKFDTAAIYGNTEELLGQLICTARQNYHITTKIGFVFLDDGKIIQDFSVDNIKRSVENSLRRLKTNYIDALLLHNPHRDFVVKDEMSNFLNELISEGVIRSYGVSCRTVDQAEDLIKLGFGTEFQVYFNAFDRRAINLLKIKKNNRINIRAPLAAGFLSQLDYAKNGFDGNDERSIRISGNEKQWLHNTSKKIFDAWKTDNPAIDAIRFCLSFNFDDIIAGCRTAGQVKTYIEAYKAGKLSLKMLEATYRACPEIYEGWK